jgi:hypothetical protein
LWCPAVGEKTERFRIDGRSSGRFRQGGGRHTARAIGSCFVSATAGRIDQPLVGPGQLGIGPRPATMHAEPLVP